jgi:ABC-2 type transport system ATP-binding protein
VIRVSHLTKRYGSRVAVDDVSFEVGRGEVVGFLGPNGAGKTTTLRILAGVLGPTRGSAQIATHDIVEESFEARRLIGYMPEAVPLYPEMRVVEYLRFRADLKRVPRGVRPRHVEEAMQKAGVLDVAHKRIDHLSKGYRQRVGIADAIVAKPPIVILDEPTAGLDPNQIRQARALIRELGREHTVVLSTHILSEVEACATRVLLIHRGKLVAHGATSDIRTMRHGAGIEISVRGDPGAVDRVLRNFPSVGGVEPLKVLDAAAGPDASPVVRLRVIWAGVLAANDRGNETERVVAALASAGLGVREVHPAGGSLEEVFAALTTDSSESPDSNSAPESAPTQPSPPR